MLHLDPSSMAVAATGQRLKLLSSSLPCCCRLASSAPLRPSTTSLGVSPLQRFRSGRPLAVTEMTGTEWCEKQTEFSLIYGKPKRTEAMVAGLNRHKQLEKEVLEKVKVPIKSSEEHWAMKLMNFIVGANQLLFEGLTREVPVIGVMEGTWISGIVDELYLSEDGTSLKPFMVDTKTRKKAKVPMQAQKRNARFQLMCYKYLWDSLVNGNFPADNFLEHFKLNPKYALTGQFMEYIASLGHDAKTFDDVFTYFLDTCLMLYPSQEQLLLRYELQSDNSILEEDNFSYDADWLKRQTEDCLQFWSGAREARFVSSKEMWKCEICAFNKRCSGNQAE